MNQQTTADPLEIRRWVEFLADEIGARPYTSPQLLRQVADRLSAAFRSLGYQVEEQPFYYRGEIYYNIIAIPRTSSPNDTAPLVIVGAHYDTVSYSPGADDNASGVAGLMELARVLREAPPSARAFCGLLS